MIECVSKGVETTVYKWKKPIIGKPQILLRKKGEWLEWCVSSKEEGLTINTTVRYLEKSGQCFGTGSIKTDDGMNAKITSESFIDFEIFSREHQVNMTTTNSNGEKESTNKTIKYECKKL